MKRIAMMMIVLMLASVSVFGADWSKPALTDTYSNFLLYINNKINDSALWLDSVKTTATNVPANAKRYNAATNTFQRYSTGASPAWVQMKTNIVGNVTGNLVGSVTGNVTGSITGDANTLDGQHGSYYLNATNMSAGTLPLAQIPATLTGKDADTLDSQHGSYYSPPGSIVYMATSTCPAGYLAANGAAVARTTYSSLFTAIGTTFGIGNGSTTFNVPDLRGEFIRGWDNGRGIDVTPSARVFGSAQTQDLQAHSHNYRSQNLGVGAGAGGVYGAKTVNAGVAGYIEDSTGIETRPRNIALLACIHI